MKKYLLLLAVLFTVLSACSKNGGTSGVVYNSFVLQQLNATAENTDPVDINDINFVYHNDEAAFDSVLN